MRFDEQHRFPVALLAATSIWCLVFAFAGVYDALLFLAPALLLALPPSIRRYPGERALRGIISRWSAQAREADVRPVPISAGGSPLAARLRLLAGSLSRRGPPPAFVRT